MVEFPAAREAAARTVFVVDDSISVCKAIQRMLSPGGVEVVEIHSGREALARIEAERPDLVICDMVLPDLEGLEICRRLRAGPGPRKPFLLISGFADDEVRRRARQAGADGVLKKPFQGEALAIEVAALLEAGGRPAGPAPVPAAAPPGAELPVPAAAPRERPLPEPARRALAELERLADLEAGGWRLDGGGEGRLSAPGEPGAGPAEVLGSLRRTAARLGFADPMLIAVEGGAGSTLIWAHHEGRGGLWFRLRDRREAGRARYLAWRFLRSLDAGGPRPASSEAAGHPDSIINPHDEEGGE